MVLIYHLLFIAGFCQKKTAGDAELKDRQERGTPDRYSR
jgi:hypothetical protein